VVFKEMTLRHLGNPDYLHLFGLLCGEYTTFLMEHQLALETGETLIAAMAEDYKNNSTNVSNYIEQGNCKGVLVSVKRKQDPTIPIVGSNDADQHPVPVKLWDP
jgi:hypothetical protein